MNRLVNLSLLLLLALTSLIPATTLAAPNDFNLTTSPLPIDLVTTPGHSITTNLRVQNSGTEPMTLKVGLRKFKADGTTGSPLISNCSTSDDFCKWVSFSKTSFLAQPGEWYNISMTISPPKDSGFGYYYAVLFSNANPPKADSSRSDVLTGAAATMVLVDVQAPGEKRQIKLTSFKADKKLYQYLPANFSVSVHNSGNIHLIPSGSIYIKQGSKTIATLDMNPNGGNVLPQSNRTFNAAWDDGFPVYKTRIVNGKIATDKQGQPQRTLNWNFSQANKLRLGHYTAHLVMTYNDGKSDIPLEGDVSFWVIPWKLILIFLVIAALVGLGLWTAGRSLMRRFNKVKNRASKHEA